jgi:hypothetical protein
MWGSTLTNMWCRKLWLDTSNIVAIVWRRQGMPVPSMMGQLVLVKQIACLYWEFNKANCLPGTSAAIELMGFRCWCATGVQEKIANRIMINSSTAAVFWANGGQAACRFFVRITGSGCLTRAFLGRTRIYSCAAQTIPIFICPILPSLHLAYCHDAATSGQHTIWKFWTTLFNLCCDGWSKCQSPIVLWNLLISPQACLQVT